MIMIMTILMMMMIRKHSVKVRLEREKCFERENLMKKDSAVAVVEITRIV